MWVASLFFDGLGLTHFDIYSSWFEFDMVSHLNMSQEWKDFFEIVPEMEEQWDEDEDVVTPVIYILIYLSLPFSFIFVYGYIIMEWLFFFYGDE
jgi:hypothetical protein